MQDQGQHGHEAEVQPVIAVGRPHAFPADFVLIGPLAPGAHLREAQHGGHSGAQPRGTAPTGGGREDQGQRAGSPRTYPAVPVGLHGAVDGQDGAAAVQPQAGGVDGDGCGENRGVTAR